MNRRLGCLLFALNAGVVGGGVTSSLADEAGIKARIGELLRRSSVALGAY